MHDHPLHKFDIGLTGSTLRDDGGRGRKNPADLTGGARLHNSWTLGGLREGATGAKENHQASQKMVGHWKPPGWLLTDRFRTVADTAAAKWLSAQMAIGRDRGA
jgi:hypothetical protein